MRTYIVVTGSDWYTAVISLAELLPTFGGQQVSVALAQPDSNNR